MQNCENCYINEMKLNIILFEKINNNCDCETMFPLWGGENTVKRVKQLLWIRDFTWTSKADSRVFRRSVRGQTHTRTATVCGGLKSESDPDKPDVQSISSSCVCASLKTKCLMCSSLSLSVCVNSALLKQDLSLQAMENLQTWSWTVDQWPCSSYPEL